jgi:hypothetical protein
VRRPVDDPRAERLEELEVQLKKSMEAPLLLDVDGNYSITTVYIEYIIVYIYKSYTCNLYIYNIV